MPTPTQLFEFRIFKCNYSSVQLNYTQFHSSAFINSSVIRIVYHDKLPNLSNTYFIAVFSIHDNINSFSTNTAFLLSPHQSELKLIVNYNSTIFFNDKLIKINPHLIITPIFNYSKQYEYYHNKLLYSLAVALSKQKEFNIQPTPIPNNYPFKNFIQSWSIGIEELMSRGNFTNNTTCRLKCLSTSFNKNSSYDDYLKSECFIPMPPNTNGNSFILRGTPSMLANLNAVHTVPSENFDNINNIRDSINTLIMNPSLSPLSNRFIFPPTVS